MIKSIKDWHEAERFWESIINSITLEKGYPDDWVNYTNRTLQYGNGSPFEFPEDFVGLGVYERRSLFLSKGIRILQALKEETPEEIVFWVYSEKEFLDVFPPYTLIIYLTLTELTLIEAQRILTTWIDIREIKEESDLI